MSAERQSARHKGLCEISAKVVMAVRHVPRGISLEEHGVQQFQNVMLGFVQNRDLHLNFFTMLVDQSPA